MILKLKDELLDVGDVVLLESTCDKQRKMPQLQLPVVQLPMVVHIFGGCFEHLQLEHAIVVHVDQQ